jgi:Uma2 family endonuclease
MTAAKKRSPISVEEYLAGEEISSIKHEYRGGYVYAMAGARSLHNEIATNITVAVGGRLRGKRCRPYNSDMKVRVPPPPYERFFYPDASVTCSPIEPDAAYLKEPVVLFEVLSKGTRRIDEGEKLDGYLTIPSLRIYALVEQESALVTVFRRRQGNEFEREVHDGLSAIIGMPEIDIDLPLAEIYERIEFTSEPDDDE